MPHASAMAELMVQTANEEPPLRAQPPGTALEAPVARRPSTTPASIRSDHP